VSAALLLLSVAVLSWPGRRRRSRPGGYVGSGWSRGVAVVARVPVWLVAGCGAAGIGALASTGLVALVAGVGAGLAGRAVAARRREAQQQSDLASLADALAAFGAELRSGRPVERAVQAASAAAGDEHCARALSLAVRSPTVAPAPAPTGPPGDALAAVSRAVVLSSRTGCSLAAVVGAVEDDVRARMGHARELRTATAGPRASALLLAGLPLLGLLMGSGVGADPWHVLTGTAAGHALLVCGAGLEGAGLLWSGRLVARALR
jgi:tight adherence protein B